jgi:hypothetical protein
MKTTFRTTVLVLALGITGAAAWAQSGVVGELSKGLSNPSAGPTPDPMAAQDTAKVDNGALPGDSHVRIVRLSDAKGQLALDRNTGAGFERTMQNMPIVEGERLQTGDGYAEVEFEDNSTLRLTPNSGVTFPLLALRSSGAKASTMKVTLGTVYVTTESTKGNEFLVEAGNAKMTVAPSTHLRLEFDGQKTVLSVFNGSVEVQQGSDTAVVNKKETLTLEADQQVAVVKKVSESPYDAWDKDSNDYHQRYAAANTFAGGGNAFGLSDLNYYGNFINAGAFGSFWQPYFIGAGWSPYANGLWALYPGAGYSFVSPYPWGWLPYHSGAWSFYPGYGWGWQPGGTFNGLNNIVASGAPVGALTKTGVSSPLRPAELPQVPTAGTTKSSLVVMTKGPIVYSQQDKAGNFVFQRDSAGLGVPRGSLGDLNKVANDVGRHGSASMPVYASSPGGQIGGASRGPVTLRSASAGNGSMAERGNSSVSSASRQGGYEGSTGVQSASRGGGTSQPAAAPMSSPAAVSAGGSHGSVASPK